MADNVDKLPICKYGKNCYRKNVDHLKRFSHPDHVDDKVVMNLISRVKK